MLRLFEQLTVDDLVRILEEANALNNTKPYFLMMMLSWNLTMKPFKSPAKPSNARQARGLRSIAEETMLDVMFGPSQKMWNWFASRRSCWWNEAHPRSNLEVTMEINTQCWNLAQCIETSPIRKMTCEVPLQERSNIGKSGYQHHAEPQNLAVHRKPGKTQLSTSLTLMTRCVCGCQVMYAPRF